jgi:AcrR family transcriptional regulator
MPPRPYDNATRLAQQAELKARIAAAAAELHAAQGALATSYAQVAERAGVSLPTVYKHFPTLEELVRACSAHADEQAPPFPHEAILAAPDLPGAALALVNACDAANAHFEPWAAWREHTRIGVLGDIQQSRRRQMLALCKALIERHAPRADAKAVAATWESLLSFDFWHRLVRTHGWTRTAARAQQHHLLLAAAGPQPAASPSSRPKTRNPAS